MTLLVASGPRWWQTQPMEDGDEPRTAQAQTATFAAAFRPRVRALGSALEPAGQLDQKDARKELSELRRQLNEAVAFLPPYDHRIYEKELSTLEGRLAERHIGTSSAEGTRKRFAFKRSAPAASALPPLASNDAPAPHAEVPPPDPVKLDRFVSRSTLMASSAWLSDLTLSDFQESIFDFLTSSAPADAQLSALRILRCRRCVLLAGLVDGSVYVEDWTEGVAIVSARQLRIHATHNVIFHVATASSPVIERSSNLSFGSYPASLPAPHPSSSSEVQDFDHPVGQSPNWRHASASEDAATLQRLEQFRSQSQSNATPAHVAQLLQLWL